MHGKCVVPAKSILSVVAMISFPSKCGVSAEAQQKFAGRHFLYEKMGLGGADSGD
jgi:hypothetical protein